MQEVQKTEKRKDTRGRVLRTGESQRPDGSYQFRWSEGGERRTRYAPHIGGPPAKEDEIARQRLLGRLSTGGSATEWASWWNATCCCAPTCGSVPAAATAIPSPTCSRMTSGAVRQRMSRWGDCKLYFTRLQQGGLSYESIRNDHSFLSSVFKNAVEEAPPAGIPFHSVWAFSSGSQKRA